MNFSEMKDIAIPEGKAISIACGGKILWQKQQKQKYKRELLYLESTGTQYIDTGVNKIMFKNNDKIAVGLEPLNISQASYIFGCVVGSRGCAIRTRNAALIQATLWQGGGPSNNNVDTIYKKFDIELSISEGFILDGVLQATAGNGKPNLNVLTYFPLCVGAYVEASGSGATNCTIAPKKGRYYYLRVEQNGVLVRDMIPVLDWNDAPCMYDKVSGELFYNQGTGEFLYKEKEVA